MSVQFGRWNFDGQPVDRDYLEKVRPILTPSGPDDAGSFVKDNIGILYSAFHTTKESRAERQPHLTSSGAILTWDGRLDNRHELIPEVNIGVTVRSTDIAIVAAAYEKWGTSCLGKLVGDWALSVWEPNDRSLVLAEDPIGTRHLYYSLDRNGITWSSILDPLVLFADKVLSLEEEYIAGWLSFFPATHLTPFVGIHAVSPSSLVFVHDKKRTIRKYWDFDPSKRIRYNTDGEYEEHFRTVFTEAIRRRLRSDGPILAELSGGMDSSSIVSVADLIIAGGTAEASRLDTVSYFSDSEPNWDEHPFFTVVENKRGKSGCHINVGSNESFDIQFGSRHFAPTPNGGGLKSAARTQFAQCLMSQGNRVVLSGTGGDEAMGGVPTPLPELEDLLARAHFAALAHQLKIWAINKRKPWFHLLLEAVRDFLPPVLVGPPSYMLPAPWLHPKFIKNHRRALTGYLSRIELFGPLPSFQQNVCTLDFVRRQLACDTFPTEPPFEKRYPYLDRDLLEFIYATPREQLARPGQRRSLMRRALLTIVPDELLNRKRKASVARTPMVAISAESSRLLELTDHLVTGALGILDATTLRDALERVKHGRGLSTVLLMRAFTIELWLRSLNAWAATHP